MRVALLGDFISLSEGSDELQAKEDKVTTGLLHLHCNREPKFLTP